MFAPSRTGAQRRRERQMGAGTRPSAPAAALLAVTAYCAVLLVAAAPPQHHQPQQQHKHVRIVSAVDCCRKRDEATIVETKNLQHEYCEELRD